MTDIPFATFVQNAALLLAVAVVFDAGYDWFGSQGVAARRVLTGGLLGVIGVSLMLTPFQFAPGLFFDSRVALLTTVGLFFGGVPTAIAAGLMSAFRVTQGGVGVVSGIAVIWAAGLVGLAWRGRPGLMLEGQTVGRLWIFGITSHAVAFVVIAGGLWLTLAQETAATALRLIALPYFAVSPVATALLGSLLVSRLMARQLTAANRRLQAEVEAQLEEVRASRARIVAAGDLERKRVERDLHDGAQQRLISLTLALRLLRSRLGSSPDPSVAESLEDASQEAKAALVELRELARGIHPQVLTESGLGPAIASLANRSPVDVDVDVEARRLPSVVESTAYFVVSEALANVAKYAGATRALVRARQSRDRLVVEVIDDGVGGADLELGTGLRGLVDRLAAIGGTLDIHSPKGQGTRLVARLPVEAPTE